MKTVMLYSEAAKETLTEACEGFPDKIYLDPVGIPTGGYGHTKGLTLAMVGQPVSQAQADAWLESDLQATINAVNSLVAVPLTQHQFDALVDFAFNVGKANFASSTLLKLVNANDMDNADDQFGRWVFAKGKRLPGLVKRRQLETAWFSTPDRG